MRPLIRHSKYPLRQIGSTRRVVRRNGSPIFSHCISRALSALPAPTSPRLSHLATHLHGLAPPQTLTGLRRMINVVEIDTSGNIQTKLISFARLKEESRLHARDILIVDNNSPITQPRILPRKNCIVVTIGPARLIVWHDKVYCFGTSSLPAAKDYATSLSQHLAQYVSNENWSMEDQYGNSDDGTTDNTTTQSRSGPLGSTFLSRMSYRPSFGTKNDTTDNNAHVNGSGKHDADPMKHEDSNKYTESTSVVDTELEKETATIFEFVVLEHALLTQSIRQSKRVDYAQKLVERVLSRVNTVERDDGNLSALFPLGNTVIHYEMVTRGICDAIRALLDDDRDMRETCLTDKVHAGLEVDTSARTSKSHQNAHYHYDGGMPLERAHSPPLTHSTGSQHPPKQSFQATLHPPTAYPLESSVNGRRTDDENQSLFPARRPGPVGPYGYAQSSVLHSSSSAATEQDRIRDVEFLEASERKYAEQHPPISAPGEQVYGRSYWGGHSSHPLSRHEQKLGRVSDDTLLALELMLESVYSVASDANMRAVELSRTLRAKQDLLELQQSNYRNHLLSVSLKMSIGSLSLTAATFLTSAFGQNLTSGIEELPGFLWVTSFASGALAFAVFRALDNYAITSSPTMAHAKRLQALHEFLFKLDTKVDSTKNPVLSSPEETPTTTTSRPSSPLLPRSAVTPLPSVPPRTTHFHREDWAALTNGEISQPGLPSGDVHNETDEIAPWATSRHPDRQIGVRDDYPIPGTVSEGNVVKRFVQGTRDTVVNYKPVKVMTRFVNRFFGPPTSTLEDDAVRSYRMKMEQTRQKHRSRQYRHWSLRNGGRGSSSASRETPLLRPSTETVASGPATRSTSPSQAHHVSIDYRDIESEEEFKEINSRLSSSGVDQAPDDGYLHIEQDHSDETQYTDTEPDSEEKVEEYDEKSLTSFTQEGTPQILRSMRPLTKEQFRELHEKATGRQLSSEETDLLFDLLDADGDGSVSLNSSEASLIDPQESSPEDNGDRRKRN